MENTWLLILFNLVCFYFSEWELWLFFSKSFKQHDWLLRLLLAVAVSRPLRDREESLLDKQAPREALPSSSHSMSLVFTLSGASQCSSKHNIFKFSAFPAALCFLLSLSPLFIHQVVGSWIRSGKKMLCTVSAQDLVLL